MVYLNRIEIAGNLVADPELRYTPSGAAVTTFKVAVQHNYKDGVGEQKQEVGFFSVVAWKRCAELCKEFLKKGSNALVIGRISNRSWDGQDGQKHFRTEIIASQVIFLDRKLENKVVAETEETSGDTEPQDILF